MHHRERRIAYDIVAQGQLTGIKLEAPSLQRLFIDAALAAADYRIALDLVKDANKETLTVKADSLPVLFTEWINATATLFTQKKFLPYRIVFNKFDGKAIEALLTGENYESSRHGYPRPFTQVAKGGLVFSPLPDDAGIFRSTFYLE